MPKFKIPDCLIVCFPNTNLCPSVNCGSITLMAPSNRKTKKLKSYLNPKPEPTAISL